MPHGKSSSGRNWRRQLRPQLQPGAMDAGSDSVRRQPARVSDFVIAQPRHLTHEEHVTVEVGQRGESLVDSELDIL